MSAKISRREFLKLAGAAGLFLMAPPGLRRSRSLFPGERQWMASGHVIAELAGFDNALRDFMLARHISGGALAVTRNGRLVLARGYTYSDDAEDLIVQPTSLFRIASISKPVTSAAVLRLAQDGQLSLDDKIANLLTLTPPNGQSADPRLASVTVRNLLQHLGGWDHDLAFFDPMFYDAAIASALGGSLPVPQADIITYMNGQSMQNDPGTTYAYSNYGYCLLGRIIAAVSGQSYQEYIQQNVFAPLWITHPALGRTLPVYRLSSEVKYHSQYSGVTVFNDSGSDVPYPYGGWNLENMDSHGGWLASAVDLVRFAASFDDPEACPILNPASITTMFGLPENIAPWNYTPGDWYYGCGWAVRDWGGGERNTWHDGSLDGAHSLLVRRGYDRTNWCVLFNQRDDPSGLAYSDIDDWLHAAADAVTTWPTHDLFPEYLLESVYLPLVVR